MAASCDGPPPGPTAERTELEQQLSRLREDNEKELADLRGKWLAAEGALVRMGRTLEDERRAGSLSHDDLQTRLDRLTAEVADARSDILGLRLAAPLPALAVPDPRERLLRAYEELFCQRKAGGVEPTDAIWTRWGFQSYDEWAAAWAEASASEDFERAVASRIARLCP